MKYSKAALGTMQETLGGMKLSAHSHTQPDNDPKRPDDLRRAIAVAAYYAAERRNFQAGHELEDWLDAETEVLAARESWSLFPV